jgi:hypothetical protein
MQEVFISFFGGGEVKKESGQCESEISVSESEV